LNTFDNNKNSPNKNRNPDILRAKDIFPSPAKTTSSGHNADKTIGSDFEIPKFDLAEQILARQRSLSATNRKSPEKRPETLPHQSDTCLTGQAALRSAASFPQQDLIIIKEIVTQDIQQLCRGIAINYP
jgi:hypothetical protein